SSVSGATEGPGATVRSARRIGAAAFTAVRRHGRLAHERLAHERLAQERLAALSRVAALSRAAALLRRAPQSDQAMVSRLNTMPTPGADHAAVIAASFSAQEFTVPLKVTSEPLTATSMPWAS